MNRKVSFLLLLLFSISCNRNNDPLIGRWTVEKVHVEFDESKATPEMVRQYGELEKGNIIVISKDSTLTFVSNGDTLRGVCSLRNQSIYCDGKLLGKNINGTIQTESSTPLGIIKVVYRK